MIYVHRAGPVQYHIVFVFVFSPVFLFDGEDDQVGWWEAWMIYAGLDVFITSPRDPVIDFHKSPAQNSPLLS